MNFTADEVQKTENRVVTLDFKGSLDFTIGEDGKVVDGDKTVTHQELYEMIAPKEEVEEDETLPTDTLESQEAWEQN